MMLEAWAEATREGFTIGNSRIRLEIARGSGAPVALASLSRAQSAGGSPAAEWSRRGSPIGPVTRWKESGGGSHPEEAAFVLHSGEVSSLPGNAAALEIHWRDEGRKALLTLSVKCFPDCGALEWTARLENRGDAPLPLVFAIYPVSLVLGRKPSALRVSTADPKGRHGFLESGSLDGERTFDNWIVVEDRAAEESLLVGGDLGNGILRFGVETASGADALSIRAGARFPPAPGGPTSAFELAPGQSAETPLCFVAVAHGGADQVANEAIRYLKRHVMPPPVKGSPLAACCVWLTDPDAEQILEEEILFAKRVGFDVFYHDAGWYAGSSLVPGMNDWAMGAGSYEGSRERFPHGLQELSRKVRAAGMKFGLWVDPGNVDSRRVASGEIPRSWLAMRGGKTLECRHPSLSVMTQLCLGNPEVVAWVKEKLCGIVERYGLEWMKWDPSGTVSHACDRTDHGHGAHGGAWAAYEGRREILSTLMERFPKLCGFECDPSLRHCRTNPGPRTLLPGGYQNEFMTGPMVGPYVWGSLATVRTTDSSEIREITSGWCTASTLDYSIRQHLKSGIAFGNINGMVSQMLSRAPAGYIEAFKRNLMHFKGYRHLLLGDVWHPELAAAEGWSALFYTAEDRSEAVLFVFRHPGGAPKNTVRLPALEAGWLYELTSLNDRPGRERRATGAELASRGVTLELPDAWLAKGDGFPGTEYDGQLAFGSDIIILREAIS